MCLFESQHLYLALFYLLHSKASHGLNHLKLFAVYHKLIYIFKPKLMVLVLKGLSTVLSELTSGTCVSSFELLKGLHFDMHRCQVRLSPPDEGLVPIFVHEVDH